MPPAWRPCGLLVDRSAFGALGWLVPSKPTERARPGTARAIRAARRLLRNPLTALLALGPRKFTKFMVVRACARGLGNRPPSTGLKTGFAKRLNGWRDSFPSTRLRTGPSTWLRTGIDESMTEPGCCRKMV